MTRDFIFIINNKLHNYNYLKYTILFCIILIHSYYALFTYLKTNNNMLIFVYFSIILLFYTKFNKFSYIIGYSYLLFTSYIFSINIFPINIFSGVIIEGNRNAAKENSGQAYLHDTEKLGPKISARRESAREKLEEEQENSKNEEESGPSGTYLAKRISQRKLKVTGGGEFQNPNSNKTVDTTLNVRLPKSMNVDNEVTD